MTFPLRPSSGNHYEYLRRYIVFRPHDYPTMTPVCRKGCVANRKYCSCVLLCILVKDDVNGSLAYLSPNPSFITAWSPHYKYKELQNTMSLLMSSLPCSNLAWSSWFPIAFAAVAICLISSSNRRSVRIVVPSNDPVSFWTSTNFAPLHHANTASILQSESRKTNKWENSCFRRRRKKRDCKHCSSESMVAWVILTEK